VQPRARNEPGRQLYAIRQQCRKPEVLWAEPATGHHDRLGIRRAAAAVGRRPGGPRSPAGPGPGPAPCRVPRPPAADRPLGGLRNPAQTRDAHLRTVREDPGAPLLTGVWRVRLVLDGLPAAERYVGRSLPRLT
jgi:hypothetical protein